MALSRTAEGIFCKIMEKATAETAKDVAADTGTNPANKLARPHITQTSDQLPDIKFRTRVYRTELERQIEEKKERERKRRELEAYEEEKLTRKIEMERAKLRREYLEEINQRDRTLEEARLKQQAIARRLEEIQIEEARRRDEERARRKQLYMEMLREKELEEAARLKAAEELKHLRLEEEAEAKRKRRLLEALYGSDYADYPDLLPTPAVAAPSFSSYFLRRPLPWNSRDYVREGLDLELEEIYTTAPLHMLADVYRRLDLERVRMRDIIKRRVAAGEEE